MRAQHAVGVAIGLIDDREVVYVKGYGLADREHRTATTRRTLFRWASVSKTLTAVRAMQLWEAGELDLDRDVRAYVPEFPDKGHVITVRQLLSHQSGLPHYDNGEIIPTVRDPEKGIVTS